MHGHRKQRLVHILCAFSVPQDCWEIGKICFVTLTSTRHLNFPQLPLIMLCVDNDKGAMEALALCLQELSTCLSIHGKCYSTLLMQFFSCKVYHWPQTKQQTVSIKAILFLTSKPPKCGGVLCKLPKELGTCANSVYQAVFPPPPYDKPRNEANKRTKDSWWQ